ncbi:MAG: RNA polymerase sigma factor [Victivallales bacterium]|nr:RNA polymerase sigma factor [Victivallales bacterium]
MTVEEHYKRLAPKLTNWLVATGSSYAEACDLVQDTFLKLWEMRDDLLDNDSSVSGLVFTIARNLRRNHIRDTSKITYVDEIKDGDLGVTEETTMPSDLDHLRKRLNEAFAQLPPILREAYTLFQIGELSIREIAHETGVSESLVKVRIFRAKEKLQELLADLHVK